MKKHFLHGNHINTLKWLLFALFVLMNIGGSVAQVGKVSITGVVVDELGEPMVGVNVVVKGTTNGTVTDLDGKYSVSVSTNEKAIFVYSFIGYKSQEILVGNQRQINVKLMPDQEMLDEVVVIGYGTVKRGDVTSSISVVKTDELPKASTASVGNMLTGRTPGLIVKANSAAPGGAIDFSIRGGNAPLIVIDGYPISPVDDQYISENVKETGNKLGSVPMDNNFINLNPDDIESIDILKDASATSIYGSRAANGVVLITTKRGSEGKVDVKFSASVSMQKLYGFEDMLSGQDFMRERNKITREIWMNNNNVYPYGTREWEDSMNTSILYPYTEEEISKFRGGTNWLDEVTRTGLIHNESLNIKGGSGKTKYLFSVSNLSNDGVVKNNSFNRFTTRLNLDQKFNNWLKGGVNVSYSRNNIDNVYGESGRSGGSQFAGMLSSAMEFNPTLPIWDENGNYTLNPDDRFGRPNPVSFLDAQDKSQRENILATANVELTPVKGLMIKGTVGTDIRINERKSYLPSTISIGNQESMYAYIGQNRGESYLLNLMADYKLSLDKHNWGVMGAFEFEHQGQDGTTMINSGFPSDNFGWDNMGSGSRAHPDVTSYKKIGERASYIGRINYSYGNRYLLTANIRVDGSSNFAANKQWGVFTGVSAAWKIAEEKFIKNKIDWLNDLKLRVGWGQVGDDGKLTGTDTYFTTYYYAFNNIPTAGLGLGALANPDLTWETKTSFNMGIDWGIFNSRISGTVDFFSSRIKNKIGKRQLPINQEIMEIDYNLSQVDGNHGFEIGINSTNIHNRNFKWNTNFVLSYYRNYYVKRDANYVLGINETQRQDVNDMWQYVVDGMIPAGNPNAGALKFKDLNGYLRDDSGNIVMVNGKPAYSGSPDGMIDEADMIYKGNSTPIPFSLNNSFEFGKFDVNVYFYGMFNNWQNNSTYTMFAGNLQNVALYGENTLKSLANRWSYDNLNSSIPSIFAHVESTAAQRNGYYLEKAWFLRCDNVSLGYTFKTKKSNKYFSSLRVYAAARNLFVITPYSGSDPETDSQAAYPNSRTYTFGIDITF